MKIITVTVSDSRQIFDSSWKKVEWVAQLSDTENPETVTRELQARIDALLPSTQSYTPFGSQYQNDLFVKTFMEQKISPEEEEKNTIEGINQCATIKELKDWELVAKSKWNTRAAYTKKLSQLSENQ